MKCLLIAATMLSLVGATAATAQPGFGDRDRDGVPNRVDRDRDGDGIRNRDDRNPNGAYRDRDRDIRDRDRDGVPNRFDRDRDGDGLRNRDDRTPNGGRSFGDRDRDGVPNRFDNRDNRYSYRGRQFDRWRGPAYNYPRGYGYRSYSRGQYLPRAYFASPYYVDNWSYYRLGPPPRGYRYVRVGSDILLVSIAAGLISEVINGAFY